MGPEVLDHDVRGRRQAADDIRTAGRRELDGRAAHTAGEAAVERRRRRTRWLAHVGVIEEVGVPERLRSQARLDLDDVHAELGEDEGSGVAGDEGAERQHPHVGQRSIRQDRPPASG